MTVDGGSVGGGHSVFVGVADDRVPVFSVSVRTPGLVSQGQSMGTQRTSIVLFEWSI